MFKFALTGKRHPATMANITALPCGWRIYRRRHMGDLGARQTR